MRGAEADRSGGGSREASITAALEEGMTATVRDMALASPRLTTEVAGGAAEVHRMLDAIENVWIDALGRRIHLDFHPSDQPKATVVFQPGSGAHARLYFVLGGLLARRGYQFLGVDRPGHGLSDGPRGDCTVEEAIAVADAAMAHARSRWGHPVVLAGSSMGGLLTMFALLHGLQPDAAVAHNFIYPGKLVSQALAGETECHLVNNAGEPCAGEPHARFDGRALETARRPKAAAHTAGKQPEGDSGPVGRTPPPRQRPTQPTSRAVGQQTAGCSRYTKVV